MMKVYMILVVFGATSAQLFPSGPDYGDEVATAGDDLAIDTITGPVKFYGTVYDQFWINVNGPISFSSAFSDYTESTAPDAQPFVTAYWNDLRLINGGELRWRRSTEQIDRDSTQDALGAYGVEEQIQWAAVITWFNVPAYGSSSGSGQNTFQIIIAVTEPDECGRQRTYAVLNYEAINWGYEGVAAANKGGNSGTITQLVPFSGSSMQDAPTYSNIGVPGQVVWRIDQHELSPVPPVPHVCSADASGAITAFDGSSVELPSGEKTKFSSAKESDTDSCRYMVAVATNNDGDIDWVAWNVGVHPNNEEVHRLSLSLNRQGNNEVIIRGFEKRNYDSPEITTFPFDWTDGDTTIEIVQEDDGGYTLINCDCDIRITYSPTGSPVLKLTVGDDVQGFTDGECGDIVV